MAPSRTHARVHTPGPARVLAHAHLPAASVPQLSSSSSSFSSCRLELTWLSSRATVSLTRALLVALGKPGCGEAPAAQVPHGPGPHCTALGHAAALSGLRSRARAQGPAPGASSGVQGP